MKELIDNQYGNFVIQAKDKIHVSATKPNIKSFLQELNLIEHKIKDVLIIGGGKISLYLAIFVDKFSNKADRN